MKKPLIALCLLALTLPLGCSSEDVPPDPLAKREGFCEAWATNACQQKVLDSCNSPSQQACVSAQSEYCLGIVPTNYSSELAGACLNAVKAAYKDATLSAEDIAIVRNLGAPCDQLSTGIADEGDRCTKSEDCNTVGGFTCVIKADAAAGSCEIPEEVGGGEACDAPQQVCGDTNYCDGENCLAFKKTGAVCVGDFQCKPSDRCALADAEATESTCQTRLARSEPCTTDNDCESLYCSLEADETEGLCADSIVLTLREPLCENLR